MPLMVPDRPVGWCPGWRLGMGVRSGVRGPAGGVRVWCLVAWFTGGERMLVMLAVRG
jgi:hypothetical protein